MEGRLTGSKVPIGIFLGRACATGGRIGEDNCQTFVCCRAEERRCLLRRGLVRARQAGEVEQHRVAGLAGAGGGGQEEGEGGVEAERGGLVCSG